MTTMNNNQSPPSTRRQCDFTKLIVAGYEVDLTDGNPHDFHVTFHGPAGTPYESGVWRVHVTLPEDYPFASPSIGFANKILHPNIDEASGSVCLDVINQTWRPIYSLVNIFDVFLPQLLTYPNAADPLNIEAASLFLRNKDLYERTVHEYVGRYASSPQQGHRIATSRQHVAASSDSAVQQQQEEEEPSKVLHAQPFENVLRHSETTAATTEVAAPGVPPPSQLVVASKFQHPLPLTPASSISIGDVNDDDDLLDEPVAGVPGDGDPV